MPICVNAHCLMLEVLRCIALNALNTVQKIKAMLKMSKIDQIHLRAVMLCMSETSKMGKEHTHTFWLITSLILNGFSIRKKFWKAETESFPTIPSNSMYVEDVEDRSNTPKGCNAMYVGDVEDGKRTYTHILAHNFLNT